MGTTNGKWIVVLLLLLLSIPVLAACASAGGEEPPSGRTELVYASFQPFGVDREVRQAIEMFNRTHYNDIHIEIKDYWGDDWETAVQGRERLMTELAAGNVPDILDLGYTNGTAAMLPYQQLAQKGYLEDLWPYIESDPELGREGVFEPPFEAAEVNGGLYVVFGSVRGIVTLAGAERVVENRTSWSLADLRAAFAAMPEGSTVLEYIATRAKTAERLLGMNMGNYVDWEAGQCHFDCENFRTDLEFLKELPEEIEWPSDEIVNRELGNRMEEGRQMLEYTVVSTPHDIQKYDAVFKGRASFVGFPVEDGSVGSAYFPSFTRLSMTTACQNKEAAWEIIRQLLLPRYHDQEDVARIYLQAGSIDIPINRSDYELVRETFMAKNCLNTTWGYYGGSTWVELRESTETEMQRFEDLLYSIDKIDMCDSTIYNIVLEQAGPYFAGDKTLDEAVELIQRRVTLYVNENR